MVGAATYMLSFGVGMYFVVRGSLSPHVRRELNARGIPVCMKCGYDLRASEDRCPECGTGFEHAVG